MWRAAVHGVAKSQAQLRDSNNNKINYMDFKTSIHAFKNIKYKVLSDYNRIKTEVNNNIQKHPTYLRV